MNKRAFLAFVILLCTLSGTGLAANLSQSEPQIEDFGKVSFANSCSTRVQTQINRAVAMLHSFQYDLAEKTFLLTLDTDSDCAIAYWGAAMALYHQLWDWPTAKALRKGQQYLSSASMLKKTPREQAYLHAAEAFYRCPERHRQVSRVQAYSDAMLDVHRRYPEDSDATAFYALSLLALPSQTDEGLSNQKKAIAILQKLFSAQPQHPGAAHYLIHATDTAEFVSLGLAAARTYAKIAPFSAHALHMPSH